MAVDVTPQERARIEALAHSDRPLIVADIDEVVLEFVAPFMAFLESHGHEYRPTSFHLTGNVYFKETGQASEKETVSDFLERFFGEHDTWQKPVAGALDTLALAIEELDTAADALVAAKTRHAQTEGIAVVTPGAAPAPRRVVGAQHVAATRPLFVELLLVPGVEVLLVEPRSRSQQIAVGQAQLALVDGVCLGLGTTRLHAHVFLQVARPDGTSDSILANDALPAEEGHARCPALAIEAHPLVAAHLQALTTERRHHGPLLGHQAIHLAVQVVAPLLVALGVTVGAGRRTDVVLGLDVAVRVVKRLGVFGALRPALAATAGLRTRADDHP